MTRALLTHPGLDAAPSGRSQQCPMHQLLWGQTCAAVQWQVCRSVGGSLAALAVNMRSGCTRFILLYVAPQPRALCGVTAAPPHAGACCAVLWGRSERRRALGGWEEGL